MLWTDKAGGSRVAGNPLPPKIAALLRESWWIALVAIALYLLLVLATYHRGDPGWSQSVTVSSIRNAGGSVGAHVADLMLYLFGLSAYWWVVLCGALVAWGFRRIEDVPDSDRRSYAVVLMGFLVLLLASSGIEAVRLYSLKASLPLAPGGVMGAVLGHGIANAFGFTGGTLILLLMFAAGLSLFTGVSRLLVLDRLGAWT